MTEKEKLLELIQRKQREATGVNNVDWKKIRDDWEKELKELFDKFELWLKPLKVQGSIEVVRNFQSVSEGDIGEYQMPALKITAKGVGRVHIQPVGRFVIGALGRIDFIAGPRQAMLTKHDGKGWCFVSGTGVIRKQEQLTEETFYQKLGELLS